jgi:hypothetical protein
LAAGREGKWAEDEESKLKDGVEMHGGRDWAAIFAQGPGRTRNSVFTDGRITGILASAG